MNTKEENVKELLREVIDPELMVNIIDLGLVYGIAADESIQKIDIDLTLTSRGCPMGDMIIEDITQKITSNYPDNQVEVHLVWEPAWSMEKLTEQGRIELGYF